jgi:hypothetical protein
MPGAFVMETTAQARDRLTGSAGFRAAMLRHFTLTHLE